MKIVQIENGFVHWDASRDIPDLDWAASHYAKNILFVEAPDYVHEGWAFDVEANGDARFVCPEAPEGWYYDYDSGTFKQDGVTDIPQDSVFEMAARTVLDSI